MASSVVDRLKELQRSIQAVCEKAGPPDGQPEGGSVQISADEAGRRVEQIRLILVTKNIDIDRIKMAYEVGHRDFGENRIQELLVKARELPQDIYWHFIGHLQTNKVKSLLDWVSNYPSGQFLLQSLDRSALAVVLEEQAKKRRLSHIPCLVQVNSSGETTKGGFSPREVPAFLEQISPSSVLEIHGLMTIAPFDADEEKIRLAFRSMSALQGRLKTEYPRYSWDILSMGMSADYSLAVEEGATMVRIGTAVFGERGKG